MNVYCDQHAVLQGTFMGQSCWHSFKPETVLYTEKLKGHLDVNIFSLTIYLIEQYHQVCLLEVISEVKSGDDVGETNV